MNARASARLIHCASATSGKLCRRPLRGGHSTSNVFERMPAGSRSPSAAKASTLLPPAWRTVARGNGTALRRVPVSSSNSRSAASTGASPVSTMPFGIIHAPASLFFQNGPPGLISRTCAAPSRSRNRRMPALCGDGIQAALLGRHRLRNPSAAEQAGAVIGDRRLPRRNAIFGLREPRPVASARPRPRGRERAHLDADVALVLADPVPVGDAHRLDRERAARTNDDALLLGLNADDVKRLLLPADFNPAALSDGEVHHAPMPPEHPPVESDDLARSFRLWPNTLDQTGIVAVGDEADVLTVGLGRNLQPKLCGNAPHL